MSYSHKQNLNMSWRKKLWSIQDMITQVKIHMDYLSSSFNFVRRTFLRETENIRFSQPDTMWLTHLR